MENNETRGGSPVFVEHRMLVITFKSISSMAPSYLAQFVQPRKRDERLRQNYAPTLHQGITKNCTGDSTFGTAAHRLWKELPVNILASGTLSMLRKCLKAYLLLDISTESNCFKTTDIAL